MKKLLSLFLVLVMLLSLCACSKNEAQNTDSSSNPSHASTDNTEESTNNTTEEEQESTENSTTTSGEDKKETTKQPLPDEDKQVSIKKPITTPTKDPTTAPSESTQAPADEKPTDEPSDCEHTYPTVSCTMPKMCTKCQHIAGNALPHNYKNGSCTVCGRAEMLVTFREGYWVAHMVKAGTSEQGEILSQYVLDPKLQRYSGYVCYSNASACTVSTGKIIYNNKAYHSDWYFTMSVGCTYEENGDTITITVGRGNDAFEFVLKKTSETQLIVISSTNTAYVPVGIVFVKQ